MKPSLHHIALARWLTIFLAAAFLPAALPAQQKLDIDPMQLVRQASHNEIKASDIVNYYMFKDDTQYKDHSITKEIVRTKEGGLTTTLLINGKPLTAEERKKENERLQKFANDPDARRKRRESNRKTTNAPRSCSPAFQTRSSTPT